MGIYGTGGFGNTMPAEVISYFFHHQNLKLRLHFQIVLQCAPFLKRLKASSLISLGEDLCEGLPEMFDEMDISWKVLVRKKGKCVFLFYHAEELEEYVNEPKIRKFLDGFGYKGMSLKEMLNHLEKRMCGMEEGKKGFPHEIGAFLGYPAEDVEGFIKNNGKKYLFIGYWKVYHDPFGAVKTFRAFDEARKYAVNEFLAGKSLQEILIEKG